ncbi:MAG: hypothetical protein ABIJ12_02465 [bacterium]
MNRNRIIFLSMILIILLCISAQAEPKRYISFNGEFYFDYPEDWVQLDPRLVDHFLQLNKAGKTTLDYEAAFCPTVSDPFWSGPYFIVSIDTVGDLSEKQIDSVLNNLSKSFGFGIKYFPVADFMTDLKSNTPSYDRDQKVITIINDIYEKQKLLKRHLYAMKFYEKGIATFYCYAPDSIFDKSIVIFQDVLQSFKSGDIESVLPKEKLEIADIDEADVNKKSFPTDNKESSNTGLNVAIFACLIVAMIIVLRRFKKKNS